MDLVRERVLGNFSFVVRALSRDLESTLIIDHISCRESNAFDFFILFFSISRWTSCVRQLYVRNTRRCLTYKHWIDLVHSPWNNLHIVLSSACTVFGRYVWKSCINENRTVSLYPNACNTCRRTKALALIHSEFVCRILNCSGFEHGLSYGSFMTSRTRSPRTTAAAYIPLIFKLFKMIYARVVVCGVSVECGRTYNMVSFCFHNTPFNPDRFYWLHLQRYRIVVISLRCVRF
jgi:hypothetical protein